MEADAAVQLIVNSRILKDNNARVKVVIGDEDVWSMSDVRKEMDRMGLKETIYKLADRNHVKKNFSKKLYKLKERFEELNKVGLINHIKKCFTYAMSQSKGNSKKLSETLRAIPNHLYGKHKDNCGSWCSEISEKDPEKRSHRFTISDDGLFVELQNLFEAYAAPENAKKYCVNASSQGNEAVNNIFAHQLPKIKCYNKSASSDFRVATGVCVKNIGPTFATLVKKQLGVTTSKNADEFFEKVSRKRIKALEGSKTIQKKKRRKQLDETKESNRKRPEKNEGTTYQSNVAFDLDFINGINLQKRCSLNLVN